MEHSSWDSCQHLTKDTLESLISKFKHTRAGFECFYLKKSICFSGHIWDITIFKSIAVRKNEKNVSMLPE